MPSLLRLYSQEYFRQKFQPHGTPPVVSQYACNTFAAKVLVVGAPWHSTFEVWQRVGKQKGQYLKMVGALLLTVKFLCLQSLKALIKRTFPL